MWFFCYISPFHQEVFRFSSEIFPPLYARRILMKKTISLGVVLSSVFLGLSLESHSTSQEITQTEALDSGQEVQGQTALFIGDSHTANFKNGWQRQLSDSVGFKLIPAAVSGKTTYFMLDMAVYKITDQIDWCFVYGGANDMYTQSISPQEAKDNIQAIARLCSRRGVRCVVLTGFDPVKCTQTQNPNYARRYSTFQQLLLEGVEGATVVDTRVITRADCWDALCHMSPSGHAKIAERVIQVLKLKKI